MVGMYVCLLMGFVVSGSKTWKRKRQASVVRHSDHRLMSSHYGDLSSSSYASVLRIKAKLVSNIYTFSFDVAYQLLFLLCSEAELGALVLVERASMSARSGNRAHAILSYFLAVKIGISRADAIAFS